VEALPASSVVSVTNGDLLERSARASSTDATGLRTVLLGTKDNPAIG
jgi:hypothetical protein